MKNRQRVKSTAEGIIMEVEVEGELEGR